MGESRLLVVTEDYLIGQHVRESLEKVGYFVQAVVSSGEEALAVAAQGHLEMALIDIALAGDLDSIEIAKSLYQRFNVAVIYLITHADWMLLQRMVDAEPYGYVIQPFDINHIHLTVKIGLQRHRMVEGLREREEHHRIIMEAITNVSAALSRKEMLPIILNKALELMNADSACLVFPDLVTGETVIELAYGVFEPLTGLRMRAGESVTGEVIASGKPYVTDDISLNPQAFGAYLLNNKFAVTIMPLSAQSQVIGALWVARQDAFDTSDVQILTTITDISANALHRVRVHEQTEQHVERLAVVNTLGRTLAEILNLNDIYERLAQAIQSLLSGVSAVLISLYNTDTQQIQCVYACNEDSPIDPASMPVITLDPNGNSTLLEVIQPRRPLIVGNLEERIHNNDFVVAKRYSSDPARSALYVPMLAKGKVQGVIQVLSQLSDRFTQTDADLLALVGNTAAIAIENARLFIETERRMHRLTALRAMDIAISSSFDLRLTLSLLLDQVMDQLEVDAADVLLYNVHTQMLDFTAGRGFHGSGVGRVNLRLGQDLPGRVVVDRRMQVIRDLREMTMPLVRVSLLEEEKFIAYFGVPLIVKGQVVGVLEIFHRKLLAPDAEWMDFLETLATDTAIAIDNTQSFNQLERVNTDLYLANDAMLDSWARTLELRGLEPEGHFQRVVNLSLELARAVGVPTSNLIHIRRGAMLHDVGMMTIPDHILLKPGQLTDAEIKVVHQHPVQAYQMFASIAFLRPALDIPYGHHERWDASGYPRGIRGEQIPLAARIFAVVDVWDAMQSDRPHRKRLPKDTVLQYMREQAGIQFDPRVVANFLDLIGQSETHV